MYEPFDALVLVSFGGPEGPDDVLPFMENVTRGRPIPRERLIEVSKHYQHFGGRSPINDQNRALLDALRTEFGTTLPVYWGNRNWHPYLTDTFAQMHADGVKRAAAFVTSAFSSYSGCRQYRENIAAACGEIEVDKLRVFYNHPGFIEPMTDHVNAALDQCGPGAAVVFTAHSIPLSMAETSRYEVQLREAAQLVLERCCAATPIISTGDMATVVWQSRSGPPTQPWLEPDISDHLRALNSDGVREVVVVPLGFISDHMEVVWDLDTQARATADGLGMKMVRAATVGTDPRFVSMVRELVEERAAALDPTTATGVIRSALGLSGASHDVCPIDCCAPPQAPPTGPPLRTTGNGRP